MDTNELQAEIEKLLAELPEAADPHPHSCALCGTGDGQPLRLRQRLAFDAFAFGAVGVLHRELSMTFAADMLAGMEMLRAAMMITLACGALLHEIDPAFATLAMASVLEDDDFARLREQMPELISTRPMPTT